VFCRKGALEWRISAVKFGQNVSATRFAALCVFSCFRGGVRLIVKELVYNITLAGWISRLKKGPLAHLYESSYDKLKHPEEENGLIGRLFAFAEMRTGMLVEVFHHGGH
jgi:hypothetical protein